MQRLRVEFFQRVRKVIGLLVRYKHNLKVVNMLCQEGLDYKDAQLAVNQNMKPAQKVLNGHAFNRFWLLMELLFYVGGAVANVWLFFEGYLSLVLIAGCLFTGWWSFHLRDKIKL